jgi:hypothetical protein
MSWMAASAADPDWSLRLRHSPMPLWALVLLPAPVLCVVPALIEFRDTLRAANEVSDAGRA